MIAQPGSGFVRGWEPPDTQMAMEDTRSSNVFGSGQRVGVGGGGTGRVTGAISMVGLTRFGNVGSSGDFQAWVNAAVAELGPNDPGVAYVLDAANTEGWHYSVPAPTPQPVQQPTQPSQQQVQDQAQLAWEQEQWRQQQAQQQQQIDIQRQAAEAQQQVQQQQLAMQQAEQDRLASLQTAEAARQQALDQQQQDAFTTAHAPRWVQADPRRWNESIDSPGNETENDMITLPDGRQMTRAQALSRGWEQTTDPENQGSSLDDQERTRVVYLKATDASQLQTVAQGIAAAGGRITAAFNGVFQVAIPTASIDKLYDIQGAQLFEGSSGSTGNVTNAMSYLPPGYDQIDMASQQAAGTSGAQAGSELGRFLSSQQSTAQGAQGAQSIGQQLGGTSGTSGWGQFAPVLNAPPTVDWQTWQNMTPFEKASYRVISESARPWEQQAQDLRTQWAKSGITHTPNQTRLTAASSQPRDILGMNFTAETFGERPEDFWGNQSKTWQTADAGNVDIKARNERQRSAILGR